MSKPGVPAYCSRRAATHPTQVSGDFVEKILGHRRNVFYSLAQRRKREWNRADAEIEIVAKLFLTNQLTYVLVRSGYQPHVNLPVAYVANATESFLFEHLQQLRLDLQIDVADFVEKDCAAMGHFEQSLLRSGRTGERAFLMTE